MIEIPGYKIKKELGKGGMAAVYLAVQQGLDREVALKIMSPALAADPSFGERFVREAKIVAQLSHPQIVTVYDVGQHDRHNYIAMEYHNGGDLAEKIAQGISIEDGIRVIAAVAKALCFAHQRGYIHRDVKPENILFKANGEPVLSDFGIAKATNSDTQMTQSGSVIGTPRYMSPEQARGKKADGRADLYSLGVIFYEILTGKLPFDGEDSLSIGIKHITDPIPRLPENLKQYQAVLDKFMAKQPGNRYQTGDEAAVALEALLLGVTSDEATQMFDSQPLESTMVMESIARTHVHTQPGKKSKKAKSKQDATKSSPSKGLIASLLFLLMGGAMAGAYFYPDILPMQASEWIKVSLKGEPTYEERLATQQRESKINQLQQQLGSFASLSSFTLEETKQAETHWRELKRVDASNSQLATWKETILQRYLTLARNEADIHSFDQAQQILIQARALDGQHPDYLDAASYVSNVQTMAQSPQPQQAVADGETAQPVSELGQLVENAQQAEEAGNLVEPENDNAVYYYQQILQLEPDAPVALNGLERVAQHFIEQARTAIKNQDFEAARLNIDQAYKLDPSLSDIQTVRNQLSVSERSYKEQQAVLAKEAEQEQVLQAELLVLQRKASDALLGNRLTTPADDSAYFYYSKMLDLEPANSLAQAGMSEIVTRYIKLANNAISQDEYDKADRYIDQAKAVKVDDPRLPALRTQAIEARKDFIQRQLVASAKSLDKPKQTDSSASATTGESAATQEQTATDATSSNPATEQVATESNAPQQVETAAVSSQPSAEPNAEQLEQAAAQQQAQAEQSAATAVNSLQINILLQSAERLYNLDRLVVPKNRSAAYKYARVLELDPNNQDAKTGLQAIVHRLNQLGEQAALDNELEKSELMHLAAQKLSEKFPFLKNSRQ